MSKLNIGINSVTNSEYHADNEFLSSSNLKIILKDREKFYKEKILGEKEPKASSTAFDEGSLTHALILEPQVIASEFAFWSGLRKQGDEFESWAKTVGTKIIISRPQQIRCDGYLKAYNQNPVASTLITGGFPEQTICQLLDGVLVKTRCDYINVEKGYIVDVKTSSFPVDIDSFRSTVSQYSYELSAALYTMVAEQFYAKKFDFYFIVIDKKNLECEVFRVSDSMAQKGKRLVSEAIGIFKKCKEVNNWSNEITLLTEKSGYEILDI